MQKDVHSPQNPTVSEHVSVNIATTQMAGTKLQSSRAQTKDTASKPHPVAPQPREAHSKISLIENMW